MLSPVVVQVSVVLSTLDSGLIQIPIVVQVLVEWCQPASTMLLPATLLVALVIGVEMLVAVAAFVLAFGFPISESETILHNQ